MARPRKSNAIRKPCGRILQDELQDKAAPAALKRMLDHMLLAVTDSKFGTVLGRMAIQREITPPQFIAGQRFATLRAKADHALGVPARNPKALSFEIGGGLSLVADDPDRDLAIVRALEEAEIAIGVHSRELSALEDVCIYDIHPDTYEVKLAFKSGIARLANHWSL